MNEDYRNGIVASTLSHIMDLDKQAENITHTLILRGESAASENERLVIEAILDRLSGLSSRVATLLVEVAEMYESDSTKPH